MVLRHDGKKQSRIIADGFKVLVLDIETGPNLAYVWGLFDQTVGINQIVAPQTMLCFAAKWLGAPSKETVYYSEYHHGRKEMVEAAWKLIDEADAVVHYNGRSFDMKHLRREFLLAGLTPPSPHRDIDLLTAVRTNFKFPSNKLDYVAQALDLGKKVEHQGFELWKDCIEGSPSKKKKAWDTMRRYNIGDIELTEKLYFRLRPWIKSHPNAGLYTGDTDHCPSCGSAAIQRRGYYRTPATVFRKFVCKDCGTWSRSRVSEPGTRTETRGVT